jgi:RNA polymerase sigma-70 factor (ECF subfamily)
VPFLLFHYEEMSYRQIAELTHLSQSAVESRIHRARKKLIEKLEPWMDKI